MGITIKVGNVERDYFEKLPSETFSITIDFANDIGSGSVDSYSANAEDSSGASVGTTIIDGVSESNGVLRVGVKNGTADQIYTIVSSVTTNQTTPSGNPYSFDAKIKMRVF